MTWADMSLLSISEVGWGWGERQECEGEGLGQSGTRARAAGVRRAQASSLSGWRPPPSLGSLGGGASTEGAPSPQRREHSMDTDADSPHSLSQPSWLELIPPHGGFKPEPELLVAAGK